MKPNHPIKKTKAIICTGNKLIERDAAGPLAYVHLQNTKLPGDVQLVDGALAGLDLVLYFEGKKLVVIIDAITGFNIGNEPCVMSREQLVKQTSIKRYDHASGLLYLLHVLPDVITGPMPDIFILGIQGEVTDTLIAKTTKKCLDILTI